MRDSSEYKTWGQLQNEDGNQYEELTKKNSNDVDDVVLITPGIDIHTEPAKNKKVEVINDFPIFCYDYNDFWGGIRAEEAKRSKEDSAEVSGVTICKMEDVTDGKKQDGTHNNKQDIYAIGIIDKGESSVTFVGKPGLESILSQYNNKNKNFLKSLKSDTKTYTLSRDGKFFEAATEKFNSNINWPQRTKNKIMNVIAGPLPSRWIEKKNPADRFETLLGNAKYEITDGGDIGIKTSTLDGGTRKVYSVLFTTDKHGKEKEEPGKATIAYVNLDGGLYRKIYQGRGEKELDLEGSPFLKPGELYLDKEFYKKEDSGDFTKVGKNSDHPGIKEARESIITAVCKNKDNKITSQIVKMPRTKAVQVSMHKIEEEGKFAVADTEKLIKIRRKNPLYSKKKEHEYYKEMGKKNKPLDNLPTLVGLPRSNSLQESGSGSELGLAPENASTRRASIEGDLHRRTSSASYEDRGALRRTSVATSNESLRRTSSVGVVGIEEEDNKNIARRNSDAGSEAGTARSRSSSLASMSSCQSIDSIDSYTPSSIISPREVEQLRGRRPSISFN